MKHFYQSLLILKVGMYMKYKTGYSVQGLGAKVEEYISKWLIWLVCVYVVCNGFQFSQKYLDKAKTNSSRAQSIIFVQKV